MDEESNNWYVSLYTSILCAREQRVRMSLLPLFHTGPESHEFPRIDKYLYSWLNRTQFVKILTDSHRP